MTTTTDGGCEEFKAAGASRRNFLKGLGAVTAGGVMATMHGSVFRQTAFAASGVAANVVVVLSLRGGSDGLSIVVPYGDPAYTQARPTIGIPPATLLQTDGMFGLHPKMAPLQNMWKSGAMAAVQAVGQPVPNLSHFSAIIALEEANPGSSARIGWLNRMVGMTDPGALYGCAQIGESVPHTEIYGPQSTLSAVDVEDIQVFGPANAMPQRIAALDVIWDNAPDPLGSAARIGLDTADAWNPVLQTPETPANGATYPATDLGDALMQSARVIRANVGAEIITVDHSSWDMHTDLGTLDDGLMTPMVDELANGVAAFFTDLGDLASNVTVVTISEFGRRVIENGDAGLDHGYGGLMMLFGAGVIGSKVYGKWPGLAPEDTVDGNLAVTTDYRSVLYEVMRTRYPNIQLSTLFPGFKAKKVGVMQGA
jgi:uncharacterized protein (DUF1501 family)